MFAIKDILRLEVAPALGCTEPAAVALCAASAASLLEGATADSLELWLSPSIYKNAFAVAIPGAGGAVGIDLAGALGCFCGDPSLGLEVLAPMNDTAITDAKAFVADGHVTVNLLDTKEGIYVRALLHASDQTAEAVVEGTHDNLTQRKRNGQVIQTAAAASDEDSAATLADVEDYLKGRTLEQLLMLVESMDADDYEFVMRGVKYNAALADHGLAYGCGLGVGKTLERLVREGLLCKDMILESRIRTSAAADARMAGAKLPAMSSAGSGNHGLTAVLPIWAVKDYISDVDENVALKAIALSHVVTGYIKAHTGRLSAVCGCSIAAGAGAAAGVTYLMGGNVNHIAGAIKNLIGDVAGVICDGAKGSCALKLATAAGTAVQSALFSLHGINVSESDGIIALTPEQTTRNVGQISTEGMIDTDRTILQILMDKQFGN